MPPRINRRRLHHLAEAHPYASYADLALMMGCAQTTVSRIMRNEFGMVRNPRLTVIADFGDFRRDASFTQMQFLDCAWARYWPYGLRVRDDSGNVYEVRGFLRRRRWRQRLVGRDFMIEPVNGDGKGRRVAR